jgi:hypothetical protein
MFGKREPIPEPPEVVSLGSLSLLIDELNTAMERAEIAARELRRVTIEMNKTIQQVREVQHRKPPIIGRSR